GLLVLLRHQTVNGVHSGIGFFDLRVERGPDRLQRFARRIGLPLASDRDVERGARLFEMTVRLVGDRPDRGGGRPYGFDFALELVCVAARTGDVLAEFSERALDGAGL